MERRSYVVVTMRLTVQALFACILTLILSSSAASGSTSYDVKKSIDHDANAFTQGLEMYEGKMYESTGLYGQSQLRQISPADGSLIMSVDLPSTVFGEGLTVIDERILVLTWKSGLILEYSRNNFSSLGDYPLEGEGWGICSFSDRLYISNGTNMLSIRDPITLDSIGTLTVGSDGQVWNLNELECHGDHILANQWMTPFVHVISATSGEILSTVDLSSLPSGTSGDRNEVLNGIAWDDENGGYWVTGKNWTHMHLVTLSLDDNEDEGFNEDQNGQMTYIGALLILGIPSLGIIMAILSRVSPSALIISNEEEQTWSGTR